MATSYIALSHPARDAHRKTVHFRDAGVCLLMDRVFTASMLRSFQCNKTLVIFTDFDQVSYVEIMRTCQVLRSCSNTFGISCGNSNKRFGSRGASDLFTCDNHRFFQSLKSKDAADALLIMYMMAVVRLWEHRGQGCSLEFIIQSNDAIFRQVAYSLKAEGLRISYRTFPRGVFQ